MSAPAGAWAAGVIFGFFWALLGDTCGQSADEVEFGRAPSVASTASSSSSGETTSTAQGGAGGEGGSGGAAGTGGATTTAATGGGGAGGGGGQGGAPPECLAPADCPGEDGPCVMRSCLAGKCGVTYAAFKTEVPGGPECVKTICDGAGSTTQLLRPAGWPCGVDSHCSGEMCVPGIMFVYCNIGVLMSACAGQVTSYQITWEGPYADSCDGSAEDRGYCPDGATCHVIYPDKTYDGECALAL